MVWPLNHSDWSGHAKLFCSSIWTSPCEGIALPPGHHWTALQWLHPWEDEFHPSYWPPMRPDLSIRLTWMSPHSPGEHFHPLSHWGQGPKYPVDTWWTHWEHRQHVSAICPVIKCWTHLECAQPCDPNVPSGQMLNTFWMFIAMCPQCTQLGTLWTHSKYIVQCELHVIAGQILITFWMYLVMWPKCIQMRVLNMFRKNRWTHGIIHKHSEHSLKNRSCSENILNVITKHFWITFLGKF